MGENTFFNRYLNLFSNYLNEGIILLDNRRRISFINSSAKSILGIKGRGRLKAQIEAILNRNEELNDIIRSSLEGGKDIINKEITYKLKSREKKLLFTILFLSDLDDAKGPSLLIICNDITNLWKLHRKERELLKQLRENHVDHMESLRQIADSVAHEVRNPIASIGGYANLLLKKIDEFGEEAKSVKKYLNYIRKDAERLNAIVQQTEKYSDIREIHFKIENIVTVFDEVFRYALRLSKKQSVHIEIHKEDREQYTLYIDRARLKDSLKKLFKYSIQISEANATLATSLSFTHYDLEISIDIPTGRISEEDAHFLFDPFFSSTQEPNFDLTIVHRIITLHGGVIRSEKGKRNNLIFTISLPKEKRIRIP
jgi:nitrogen-specific signal transduction histidine kinase